MRRFLVGAAGVLGLAAALLAGALVWLAITAGDPPAAGRVAEVGAPVALAAVAVGGAVLPLEPPAEVPLGGFATRRGKGASGTRDPVHVRALVFTGAAGGVGLVSLEVVLVPPALSRAIRERARARGLTDVVVTATHTHNGPGGLWDNPLAQVGGMGAYHPAWFATVVAQADAALAQALAAARPARLVASEGRVPGVCRSRAAGRTPDPRLLQVRFEGREDGAPLGRIVVFGCHPTLLGAADHRLSGEWPGALARRLGEPTLVLQGGLGDVTAVRGEGAADQQVEALATALAAAPHTDLARVGAPGVSFARTRVVLPGPRPEHLVPAGLRRAGAGLLGRLTPAEAEVSVLDLGPVTLAFTPAEPVTAVAQGWETELGRSSASLTRVVGLSDGYLGYLETPEAFAAGAGESPRALYGPEAARVLGDALARARRQAGAPPAASPPEEAEAP